MQAAPALKGPMSVLKVPPTLQSLSGKEEEQHQAPQKLNLVNHAVRITRGEPAQTRDCHRCREVDFQHQLPQEPSTIQGILQTPRDSPPDGGGGQPKNEDTSGEQKILQTTPGPQAPTRLKSSPSHRAEE